MAKTLILIRHGHRDTERRELDNGLTDRGREQARAIRRFFTERFHDDDYKKGLWLVSSPKLRCQETLQPLAKALDRSLDVHPGLDEQGLRESQAQVQARVEGFLREWVTANTQLTVLCSHGDWLPMAISRLLGVAPDLKKGCWFEVEWEAGSAALRWYIPSFKPFYREK